MEEKKEKQVTTRTGFVASDAKMKVFESGRKVTNVTIMAGSGDDKKVTYVRGWNAMADRLMNIKTGEKWEFKGEISVDTKDGKSYEILTARESYPHVKMEVQGEVKHLEDRELGKTNMRKIMIMSSEMQGGKEVSNPYNIELYGEKNMARAADIKIGDVVSAKGHVRIYEYVKDGENKVNKSFQNPFELKNLSAEMATGAGKEAVVDVVQEAEVKKRKTKDKGLGV